MSIFPQGWTMVRMTTYNAALQAPFRFKEGFPSDYI